MINIQQARRTRPTPTTSSSATAGWQSTRSTSWMRTRWAKKKRRGVTVMGPANFCGDSLAAIHK